MSRRGMTLLEVMVAGAILAVMMAGVLGSLTENQRQYLAHADISAIQSTLRTGTAQIETAIARAGYGIDPNLAVEPWTLDAAGLETGGGMRDGTGAFGSDALVVQYRDPLFRREISSGSASTGSITLSTALAPGETLERGQRLLLMCDGGATAAYVTVAAYVPGTRVVSLLAGANAPFNQTALVGAAGCFNTGTAVALRIERRHFFVMWFNEPAAATQRPALLVRRGVDLNGNGTIDEAPLAGDLRDAELIALDVEQLQVAYVMNRPQQCLSGPVPNCINIQALYGLPTGPDSDGNFVYGDQLGANEVPTLAAPWTGSVGTPSPARPPLLSEFGSCSSIARDQPGFCGYGAMRRFTGHPGNIRTIRVTLAARSGREDQALGRSTVDLLGEGPMENLAVAQLAAPDRRRRQRLSTTVTLKNMYLRRHFSPVVSVALGLNVDGG